MVHKALSKPPFQPGKQDLSYLLSMRLLFRCFLWGKVEHIVAAGLTCNTVVFFLDLYWKRLVTALSFLIDFALLTLFFLF